MSRALSLASARRLLDFKGRADAITPTEAEEQLHGAVATHNILVRHEVAYIADEVGKGKTYIALGALALLRHYDPRMRVLIIAPKENLQHKWLKELRNFTEGNFKFPDLRMKALHGQPARPAVICENLVDFAHEAAVNPERDFILRLPSFSLAYGSSEMLKKRRDELRGRLPGLERGFDLSLPKGGGRGDEGLALSRFKTELAAALNSILPAFDLVIFDEGHNLKHGWGKPGGMSHRNQVLGVMFGKGCEAHPKGRKLAKRVMFLSATPLEDHYRQLWNQLDLFGFGRVVPGLKEAEPGNPEIERELGRILIRRVTSISVGGRELTKNQYRREWRNGGVDHHDEPQRLDDLRQKLVVALVQKKVSETLADPKFGNAFQIGMLASFESFLQTAVKRSTRDDVDEAPPTFDDAEQTDSADERLGADRDAVARLARQYRKHFGVEMPHPKMERLVDHLAGGFESGEKALIFVRRIASVTELQRKLLERYDDLLTKRLQEELLPACWRQLGPLLEKYRTERREWLDRTDSALAPEAQEPEPGRRKSDQREPPQSIFSWFFRGDGPGEGIFSGAALAKRFSGGSSRYETFFHDNDAAWVLGLDDPRGIPDAMAAALGRPRAEVLEEVSRLAREALGDRAPRDKEERQRHSAQFEAVQRAAVNLLTKVRDTELKARAETVMNARAEEAGRFPGTARKAPDAESLLSQETFFTALRRRPALRAALWPESLKGELHQRYREQELRRELLSTQCRLGHAFIDLYLTVVGKLGTLVARARGDEEIIEEIITRFLDLLETQRVSDGPRFMAFRELAVTAAHFDLIIRVNAHELLGSEVPLRDVSRRFGELFGQQLPVAGMHGALSRRTVGQFRMPGYPWVLISTDLLQEGEDLHTFCHRVYHYGLSYMPSSIEQRVGRIDRLRSLTHRRLSGVQGDIQAGEKLQVYYPHLQDTVEVLQAGVVYDRINRFLEAMHKGLTLPKREGSRINIDDAVARRSIDWSPPEGLLESAFPVKDEHLEGDDLPLAVDDRFAAGLLARFNAVPGLFPGIEWSTQDQKDRHHGTIRVGSRRQPFSLIARSFAGRLLVLCISPVGRVEDMRGWEVLGDELPPGTRIGRFQHRNFQQYDLTVESDQLLAEPESDLVRLRDLIQRVTTAADRLEAKLLGLDQPLDQFSSDLKQETTHGD